MAFDVNLTGTAQVSSAVREAYDAAFIVESTQAQIMNAFATKKMSVGAKSVSFSRYGKLPVSTTPLVETQEVPGVLINPGEITFELKEYGEAVTTTQLASLFTEGEIDVAAVRLVADHMGRTLDALALAALLQTANVETGSITGAQLSDQARKLAIKNVPKFGNAYVGIANENTIEIFRGESAWIDVAKYADATAVLRGEVGMYKGHRIVSHNGILADGTLISLGQNALGLGVALEPRMVATGPFDKLARLTNLGWKSVLAYGIVDADAVQVFKA